MTGASKLRSSWRALSRATGLDHLRGTGDLPSGATSGLGRLLWTDPRPLIFPRHQMIVVFSPKSACTTVVIWFFHQLGYTAAARDYSAWPHRYRTDVYYKSAAYRRAYESDLSNFSLVRIVRDPFERAVSSFRHVQRGGLADKAMETKLLGRRGTNDKRLSFAEFLDFLERCNLETCDPHYGSQRHPIEDVLPTRHLINASTENLLTRLNEVEADFGLPITDFDKLKWLRKISRKHIHVDAPSVPIDAYTHRFTRDEARSGYWPPYSAFLTPTARERLTRLYATDIKAYCNRSTDRSPRQRLELVSDSHTDARS